MASGSKRKTTMAKLNRERKVIEKRVRKEARKQQRRQEAAENPPAEPDPTSRVPDYTLTDGR
jgi:hypothetical protein